MQSMIQWNRAFHQCSARPATLHVPVNHINVHILSIWEELIFLSLKLPIPQKVCAPLSLLIARGP